jgi:hypothetical protein
VRSGTDSSPGGAHLLQRDCEKTTTTRLNDPRSIGDLQVVWCVWKCGNAGQSVGELEAGDVGYGGRRDVAKWNLRAS